MILEFLTDEEIQRITEYRYPNQQCKELLRLGIKFERTRTGKPLVLRQVVVERFTGQIDKSERFVPPDLDALREVNG